MLWELLPFEIYYEEDQDDPEFNVLREYLKPRSTMSSIETARHINDLIPSNARREDGRLDKDVTEDFLHYFWILVVELSQEIPKDDVSQDKLVNVIQELRQLSPSNINLDEVF